MTINAPPHGNLSILIRLVALYKVWQECERHIPKIFRYSLGIKIDNLFIEIIELILSAKNSSKKEKIPLLASASKSIDLIKFFLYLAWDTKTLDNKKYLELSTAIQEIGRMAGGWQRQLEKELGA